MDHIVDDIGFTIAENILHFPKFKKGRVNSKNLALGIDG